MIGLAATFVDAQRDRFAFDEKLAVEGWADVGPCERLLTVGRGIGRWRFEGPAEGLGGAQHRVEHTQGAVELGFGDVGHLEDRAGAGSAGPGDVLLLEALQVDGGAQHRGVGGGEVGRVE